MKGFSTRSAGEGALGDAFVVGFQVTVENRFVCETLVTARAFERLFTSVNSLMGLQVVWASESLATDVTAIFFSRLFRWRLSRTRFDILQLILITYS